MCRPLLKTVLKFHINQTITRESTYRKSVMPLPHWFSQYVQSLKFFMDISSTDFFLPIWKKKLKHTGKISITSLSKIRHSLWWFSWDSQPLYAQWHKVIYTESQPNLSRNTEGTNSNLFMPISKVCHWSRCHELHVCSTTFSKEYIYKISPKTNKWFSHYHYVTGRWMHSWLHNKCLQNNII